MPGSGLVRRLCAVKLPFGDGEFGAVVCAFGVMFVPDKKAVFVMPMNGYVEAPEGGYMLTWIDRGADVLHQAGRIGKDVADALKAEARRRSEAKAWFGHIAFASVLARKGA